jgi:hypothetical protein
MPTFRDVVLVRPCSACSVPVLCSQLRHQKPLGFVGLWPEYSMLNHSCAPNTSILVVRERMLVSEWVLMTNQCCRDAVAHACCLAQLGAAQVPALAGLARSVLLYYSADGRHECLASADPQVHAAQEVEAGEELTRSYIGPAIMKPEPQR